MKTRIVLSVATIGLAACSNDAVVPSQVKSPGEPSLARQEAPLLQLRGGQPIPGQYIVVLQDNADPAAVSASHTLTPLQTYRHSIRGFAARLSREQLDVMRRDGAVKYIEQDGIVSALENAPVTGSFGVPSPPSSESSQANPPWNLDRIDQPTGLNANYTYTNNGKGVKVYVAGTGIRFTHTEFDGVSLNRAKTGIDLITPGGPAADCNGHGTHMAGTIGGTTVGIAKGVTLYSVRVLDCAGSGMYSTIIAGIDWVTYNHLNPSIGHATFGGGVSQALNDAITKSTLYGTLWVATAGNGSVDACNFSPGSTPLAITVSASDMTDHRAPFTNFGPCVDLYAPGVNILSAAITNDNAFVVFNGSASASAHAVGLAALFLQTKTTATPTEVRDVLVLNAQPNVIINNPANTANLLANKQTGNCNVAGAYCAGITGNAQLPLLNGSQFYLSGTGTQRGYLRGTPGTNFNLELYEWNGAAWILRVNKATASTNETITFNSSCAFGLANCFKMYKVKSGTGTGSFDFWYDRQ
jgi:hypothetical protein